MLHRRLLLAGILFFVCTFGFGYQERAWSQDEVDEFFEDEPDLDYPEPDGPPPEDPGSEDSRFRPPRVPPINRPTPQRMGRPGDSSSFSNSSGEIEFKLVDPPKYWKPKPKRYVESFRKAARKEKPQTPERKSKP